MNVGARIAWVMVGLALATVSAAGEPRLSLSLELPKVARRGDSVTAVFGVSNRGNEGTYFKRPWKWATNGMRLEAVDDAGVRFGSSTVLYDIARESVCTQFKALGPDESYVFKAELSGSPDEGLPSLVLPPGRYRVRWVYDVSTTMKTRPAQPAGGVCSAAGRRPRKRSSSSNRPTKG